MNVGNFKPFVWPGPTRSCGYVAIPKEHFLFGVAKNALNDVFEVNGGFTFSAAGERDEAGAYVVGWDYTYAFNYEDGSVNVSDDVVLAEAEKCAAEMNAFECRRYAYDYMGGKFLAQALFFPKRSVITLKLAWDVDMSRVREMIGVDHASDIWTWEYYFGRDAGFMVMPDGFRVFSLYVDVADCTQVVEKKIGEIYQVC